MRFFEFTCCVGKISPRFHTYFIDVPSLDILNTDRENGRKKKEWQRNDAVLFRLAE